MQPSTLVLNNSVLVVDDDTEALEEMADALENNGLEVYIASGVDLALELARKQRPKFIIMDYLLRGCTGTEAASEIHKFLPGTQIIMISALDGLAQLMTATDFGEIVILKKPLSMDRISCFIKSRLD